MNQRIKRLRERLFSIHPSICPERARYFTESMKDTEGEYIAIRRAKGFANVLNKMSLYINDDELIVGNQASRPKAAPVFPEYSTNWLYNEFHGEPYFFDKRPADRFSYSEDTKDEIIGLIEYWKGKSLYDNFPHMLPGHCKKAWDAGIIGVASTSGFGNVLVDYEMVLAHGLRFVIEKAQKKMDGLDLTKAENIKKRWFLEAVIIANKAVIAFAHRLSKKCEDVAGTEDDQDRKHELLHIAAQLKVVPENPPTTFWEAAQTVWMILLAQHIETNGKAISLGRFDQYLFKFYQKDIEEGTISREKALEIIEAFFIKANELTRLAPWPGTEFFLGYQMFINLTVAGQDRDGNDAVNDLTYLCVDA